MVAEKGRYSWYLRDRNRFMVCQRWNSVKVRQRKEQSHGMPENGTESRYARERNRAKVCTRKEKSQGMKEKGTEPRYARERNSVRYAREG
jgi:hypothetical protein